MRALYDSTLHISHNYSNNSTFRISSPEKKQREAGPDIAICPPCSHGQGVCVCVCVCMNKTIFWSNVFIYDHLPDIAICPPCSHGQGACVCVCVCMNKIIFFFLHFVLYSISQCILLPAVPPTTLPCVKHILSEKYFSQCILLPAVPPTTLLSAASQRHTE